MANADSSDSDRSELDTLMRGFQISRMLRIVADLGLADRIAPGEEILVGRLAKDCGVLAAPIMEAIAA